MSKRPLCVASLVYIIAIVLILLIDTSKIASMPLTFNESAAASLIKDKEQVSISGTLYKQEIKNDKLALYLNHTILYKNDNEIKANNIIIYSDLNTNIPLGYQILVTGKAKKFPKASNPGQFNSYLYYKSLNVDFSVTADKIMLQKATTNVITNNLQKLRNRFSKNFDKITKEDTQNATFKAMVIGDSSEFGGDIKDLYQKGGILHIICISGSHVSFIGMFLFFFLRSCKINYKIACTICIGIVICYGVMTGFGVSAYRAVIMFTIAMIGKMIGRTYDILSSLALAAILILLDNPLYLINVGFLLSFGAVIGIGTVAPILSDAFEVESRFVKDFLSSMGATFVTLPILLYSFYEFPIYSILLNLIVIPISGFVLASGILGCLLAEVSVSLGEFALGLGSYILSLYEALCKFSLQLPYSTIIVGRPKVIQIIIYYLLLIFMLYVMKKWNKKRITVLIVVMILIIGFRVPQGFFITFLDVGQGDGIFIHSKENTTYMIDGGSSSVTEVGKYRMLPFLKSQGIRKLDYSIVTHPDEDHVSGIIELIQLKYPIKNLILPEIGIEDEAYRELEQLAREAGIQVIYFKRGSVLKEGELELECLHPYKEYVPASRNDYSTVLSLSYKNLDVLFTGDLETKGEEEVTKLLKKDYDILKVAHHGSKNSTEMPFLNQVKAEYGIISCAENNRYKHPHKELLDRLKEKQMNVLMTKDMGAITIEIEKDGYSYRGNK